MADWQPPQDLLDFLSDEPPLYVGFGSVSPYVSGAVLKAVITAVADRRAVFSPGWGNIDRSMLPDNFFVARDVPNEWLFSRVSLTVHHGGAGTIHTAARAGVPQIVLPVAGDQPFWAGRMAALGVAPKISRRAAMGAAAVAKMITFAQLATTRQRAQELSHAMAREDGVHTTVRELEALAKRSPMLELDLVRESR
jgi:UDP:flavonoid glycosyltransferase YjiC (YdhE family)